MNRKTKTWHYGLRTQKRGIMKAFIVILFSLFTFDFSLSQHQLPFESKDNSIELSVRNTSTVAA